MIVERVGVVGLSGHIDPRSGSISMRNIVSVSIDLFTVPKGYFLPFATVLKKVPDFSKSYGSGMMLLQIC